MTQPRGIVARRKALPRSVRVGASREKAGPPKHILCVLPRKMPVNPFKALLKGYDLATADTWTGALRLARREAHDLYVIYAPLGWTEDAEFCRKVRAFDPHTPLIVYSTQPNPAERREVRAAGAQAYVARSDGAQNLSGTAGQLIMLAELRSMEAMASGARAMEENIIRRLAKLEGDRICDDAALPPQAHQRLKLQARRMFALAGGSRANFERLWPSIYEGALKRARPSDCPGSTSLRS